MLLKEKILQGHGALHLEVSDKPEGNMGDTQKYAVMTTNQEQEGE